MSEMSVPERASKAAANKGTVVGRVWCNNCKGLRKDLGDVSTTVDVVTRETHLLFDAPMGGGATIPDELKAGIVQQLRKGGINAPFIVRGRQTVFLADWDQRELKAECPRCGIGELARDYVLKTIHDSSEKVAKIHLHRS